MTGHWAALAVALAWAVFAAAQVVFGMWLGRGRTRTPAQGRPSPLEGTPPLPVRHPPGPRLPPGPPGCTVRIWRCSCSGVWREGILADRYLCDLHATPEWSALEQEVWGPCPDCGAPAGRSCRPRCPRYEEVPSG